MVGTCITKFHVNGWYRTIRSLCQINVHRTILVNGSMNIDLTQTSYSTIPSVDMELGNASSDHSDSTLNSLADGLTAGVNAYFGN